MPKKAVLACAFTSTETEKSVHAVLPADNSSAAEAEVDVLCFTTWEPSCTTVHVPPEAVQPEGIDPTASDSKLPDKRVVLAGGVAVGVGVDVGVLVGVAVVLGVLVGVAVAVDVAVGVLVGVAVAVDVAIGVLVVAGEALRGSNRK